MSRPFPAKYDGRCPACAEVIDAGDLLIADADDRFVHLDCADRKTGPQRPAEVCPRCFITKAANGACGCEDQS